MKCTRGCSLFPTEVNQGGRTYITAMAWAFFQGMKWFGGHREEMVIKAVRGDITC